MSVEIKEILVLGPLKDLNAALIDQAVLAAEILQKRGNIPIVVPVLAQWWGDYESRLEASRKLLDVHKRFYALPHEDEDYQKLVDFYDKEATRVELSGIDKDTIESNIIGNSIRSVFTTSVVLKDNGLIEARNMKVASGKKTDAAASLLLLLPSLFHTLELPELRRFLDLLIKVDAGFVSAVADTCETDAEVLTKLKEFMGDPESDERVDAFRVAMLFLRGIQNQWADVCREWDKTQDLSDFFGEHLQAVLASEGIHFMDLGDLSPAHRLGYVSAVGLVMELLAKKDFLEDFFKGPRVGHN